MAEEPTNIYGIDLGTTYSCIARIKENNEPEIIPNAEGDYTTPSVVFFESENSVIVGKVAKGSAETDPDRVIEFVKRSMGDESFVRTIDGKDHGAEVISSLILSKLVKDASDYLKVPVTDVVITCPAYFGIKERMATQNAGILAGLKVHGVLNEPTAAAFSYGLDRAGTDQTVMVYDLGGGTFDITLIEIKGKNITVILTGGDHNLGGKDWDDAIINYFAEQFMQEHGQDQDPRDNPNTEQEIRNKAEDAKKQLTTRENYKTSLVSAEGKRIELTLTREKFEEITRHLVDQTIDLTKNLMDQAKSKGYSQIDQIVLVGGSTRMPMINTAINMLGIKSIQHDPDLAVAKGAAWVGRKYLADLITGSYDIKNESDQEKIQNKYGLSSDSISKLDEIKNISITNISSKSFGTVALDPKDNQLKVFEMIPRFSKLPIKKTDDSFSLVQDNQKSVRVQLMEQSDGNYEPSMKIEDNINIGEGIIDGLPPNLSKNTPVVITYELTDNGILTVTAECAGKKCQFSSKIQGVMSEEQLQTAKNGLAKMTVS
ncbi:Hsp70 family protein [Methanospirillum sp.]